MTALTPYSIVSNFPPSHLYRKEVALSIAIFMDPHFSPIPTMEAVATWLASHASLDLELLLILPTPLAFKHENYLRIFPQVKILIPKHDILLGESLRIAIHESVAEWMLFLRSDVLLVDMELSQLLPQMQQAEQASIILPMCIGTNNESLPSIVSVDLKGVNPTYTALVPNGLLSPSLAPAYPVCLLRHHRLRNLNLDKLGGNCPFPLSALGMISWHANQGVVHSMQGFTVQALHPSLPSIPQKDHPVTYLGFHRYLFKHTLRQSFFLIRCCIHCVLTGNFEGALDMLLAWQDYAQHTHPLWKFDQVFRPFHNFALYED